jgi:hypothetical protein
MEYPNNRADAKSQGVKFYFTGQPCKRGHIALRKTKGCCVECVKEDWQIDNEKRKGKPKSEAAKAAGKRYYEKNKEQVIARAYARPIEEKRRHRSEHKKNNPDLYKELCSLRKRRHRQATPLWVGAKEKLAIRALYSEAMRLTKLTGEQYVVDHIIPLHGETVCGLHTIKNLRVMTQEENLKKSNKLLE